MSAVALATGRLFREPEQRTSRNGNAFVLATVKAVDGQGGGVLERDRLR